MLYHSWPKRQPTFNQCNQPTGDHYHDTRNVLHYYLRYKLLVFTNRNLKNVPRTHQQDKPHKCNACYRCFNNEEDLQEHILKHVERKHIKKHICHICAQSYAQESYLHKHMQKHADRPEKRSFIRHSHPYWPKQETQEIEAPGFRTESFQLRVSRENTTENHYESTTKTTSAFTPIHNGLFNGGQLSIPANSQRYLHAGFDPTGFDFQRNLNMASTDMKTTQFQNSFLRLDQIRNFNACQPTMNGEDFLKKSLNNWESLICVAGIYYGFC